MSGESILNASIVRNAFTSNRGSAVAVPPGGIAGSGIVANISGLSQFDAAIEDNDFNGLNIPGLTSNAGTDTAIAFNFSSMFDSPVVGMIPQPSTAILRRNRIQNHDNNGVGFSINGAANGRVAILAEANTITSNFGDGFQINTLGDVRARAIIRNSNNIFQNSGSGIRLNAAGNSLLLAEIRDNIVPGGGGIRNNGLAGFAGIHATTMDSANMVLDVVNNNITNNIREGILAELLSPSGAMMNEMIVFIQQNTISGNDSLSILPQGPADVLAHVDLGVVAGRLCVSLSDTNVPSLGVINPFQACNEGVPITSLLFENDGTNSAPTLDLTGIDPTRMCMPSDLRSTTGECAARAIPLDMLFPVLANPPFPPSPMRP
jgi:hypothetical protein